MLFFGEIFNFSVNCPGHDKNGGPLKFSFWRWFFVVKLRSWGCCKSPLGPFCIKGSKARMILNSQIWFVIWCWMQDTGSPVSNPQCAQMSPFHVMKIKNNAKKKRNTDLVSLYTVKEKKDINLCFVFSIVG